MARIVTTGFGADNDTYLMLGTWDRLIHHGTYSPSRFQGSPLAELSIGALSEVGWPLAVRGDVDRPRGAGRVVALRSGAATARQPVRRSTARRDPRVDAGLPRGRLDEPRLHLRLGVVPRRMERPGAGPRSAARGRSSSRWRHWVDSPTSRSVWWCCSPGRRREHDGSEHAAPRCTPSSSPWGTLPAYLGAGRSFNIFTADRPTGQGLVGLIGRAVVKPTLLFGLVGMALLAVVIVVALVRRARRRERHGGRAMVARDDRDQRGDVGVAAGRTVVPAPHVGVVLVWLARVEVVRAVRPVLIVWLVTLVSLAWIEPHVFRFTYAQFDEPCRGRRSGRLLLLTARDPGPAVALSEPDRRQPAVQRAATCRAGPGARKIADGEGTPCEMQGVQHRISSCARGDLNPHALSDTST